MGVFHSGVAADQIIENRCRGIETDRWIEQQYLAKTDRLFALIQAADKCRMQTAQTVARKVDVGNRHQVFYLLEGRLHDPVQIFGIIAADARIARF